jgi:hypothetical protein
MTFYSFPPAKIQVLHVCKEFIVILSSRYPSIVVDKINTIALLLLFVIIVIQYVYSYTPETNHVSLVYCSYSIVTVYATCNVIYHVESSVLSTVPERAVLSVAVFFSALISCFPGILFKYYLNDFEMASVAPGLTCVFAFHINCISVVNSLYFVTLSSSYFITLLSPGIVHELICIFLFIITDCNYGWFCRFVYACSIILLP